jgi:hypothetical protein
VLYGERSARFDWWALKHPWQAAALIFALPGALASFAVMLAFSRPLLSAAVGGITYFVTGTVFVRYTAQRFRVRRLRRWWGITSY